MRISVNAKRVEIALEISISSDIWSSDADIAKQNCKKVARRLLINLKAYFFDIFRLIRTIFNLEISNLNFTFS
jgi:hypothetical protein